MPKLIKISCGGITKDRTGKPDHPEPAALAADPSDPEEPPALSSWVTGCRKSGLPDFQRPERTGPAPPGLALPSPASRAPTRTQQLPRHKRLSGARQGKKEKVLCAGQNRNQKSLVCSGRLASGRTARTAKTIIKFLGNRLPEVWRF